MKVDIPEEEQKTLRGHYGTQEACGELQLVFSIDFTKTASDSIILKVVHQFTKEYFDWEPEPPEHEGPTPEICLIDQRHLEDEPKKRAGFIYILKGQHGYFKIGKARNLDKRLKSLRLVMPFRVEVVHSFSADDCVEAERSLHGRFADKRTNGEWFVLSDKDVEYLKSL